MKIKALVLKVESNPSKSGKVYHRLIILDQDQDTQCTNTLDYDFSEHDLEKYPNLQELKGKIATLGIDNIQAGFGGRMRLGGKVESVAGVKASNEN